MRATYLLNRELRVGEISEPVRPRSLAPTDGDDLMVNECLWITPPAQASA